jgi:tetratricopeptide (TPR) repeat protein
MRSHLQLTAVALVVCSIVLMSAAAAQQRGGGKSAVPTMGTSARTTPTPTNPQSNVYYIGKVVMDTGVAPPASVAIIRICNGFRHRETYTSSDGSFSFMIGDRATGMVPDASDDSREFGLNTAQMPNGNPQAVGQTNFSSPIADCELRAELAGYTSSFIRLDPSMTNSNVGVIMMHSRTPGAGGSVSVASLQVPPKARNEYEKGSEALEKGDLANAEKFLHKAIDQYPKFAEAWMRLGDVEQRKKNVDGAMQNYQEAINADPNFPLPYLRMAFLSAVIQNWEQTRRLSEHLLSLDPVNYPLGYYYCAIAEFNLKQLDKAETNALRAESLDTLHSEPRVEVLLAAIYNAKRDYPSAAGHYRAYIKLVPNGPLAEHVKLDLAKTEEMAKSQPPHATTADK